MEDGMHINEYGHREWYLNGELHRVDGPAREWADGDKEWWLNGELHREDGPAVIWPDGSKWWYLNGKCHPSFDEWLKATPVPDEEKVFIKLKEA